METTISNLSIFPQTKAERKTFVEMAVNEILSGVKNPLEIELILKNLEETISEIRKNEEVKRIIYDEAAKYNQKSFDFMNAEITLTSRSTFNFKDCNDSVYNDLDNTEKMIKEQKKERESFLKALKCEVVNPETGEMIYPASKSTNDFLTIKIK